MVTYAKREQEIADLKVSHVEENHIYSSAWWLGHGSYDNLAISNLIIASLFYSCNWRFLNELVSNECYNDHIHEDYYIISSRAFLYQKVK